MYIELNVWWVFAYLLAGLVYGIWNEHEMDDPIPMSKHMHIVTFLTIAFSWPIHASLWIRYHCSNMKNERA